MAIPSNTEKEHTKILYSHDNIQRRLSEIFSSLEKELVCAIDNTEATIMQCPLEAILNTLSKVKLGGIKIKIITDIIPKNYLLLQKTNGHC